MAKTITVIDTFGFFFRSFYALPPLTNRAGEPTGLLTGFLNFISTLHKDHSSEYIVFALDSKGDTFRNEIDPNYKANRDAPPPELSVQLPIAIEWIEKMGFKTLALSGFEADDVIATVAKLAKDENINVRVISHDKDLYQLIDDGKVVVVDAIKRKEMNEEECFTKYGIHPNQFTDYQSILGDSADNVPGVKGIGKVGAQKLLSEFNTLENIYANIEIIKGANQKKLIAEKEKAFMSRELVTLRSDVFEKLDFEEFVMSDENPFLPIYNELVKYEMNAQLRYLSAKNLISEGAIVEQVKKLTFETILVDDAKELSAILKDVTSETLIAFDTETTGLDYEKDELVGFSFAFDDTKGYYVPFRHFYLGVGEQVSEESVKESMKKIFTGRVVGHNIKFDLHFVTRFLEVTSLPIYADTIALAWLLNPEKPLSLDKLSLKYFNHEMIPFKQTVKKGENFSNVDLNSATKYAGEDAIITFKLFEKLQEELDEPLLREASEVEFPFITTLLKMEREGIKLDTTFMAELLDEVKAKIDLLTSKIHSLANSEFNINSPKQLGTILFENLELPIIKKTKTGYSTDESVLNALLGKHEIIEKLLEYREMYKLYSTYIDPLLKLATANDKSRIYTSFIQSGTATGRLSSRNPNLQNIPARSSEGQRIRQAFIADEGKLFIGIDYSQIELRLLAHFSQDSVLVDAFVNDKDIHTQTAIALFGEDEAASKRHIAKTVNFGLLYGMGAKKLSVTLGIETKEAKLIIEKYFESFPSVKSYFRSIVDSAKEIGYVETLLARRRFFDFEKASPMLRAGFERESVNTLFQGSAADLIKLSMNKISTMIEEQNLEAKMLLQIHDELIFEVSEDKAEELAKLFSQTMQSIYTLTIPLKTSVNIGKNWGELK
ncbi:MAG: DNA polymerase I [Helicobacteraceae bacterium]|nr:DNA polymerase I [Helicobacteraceae bacterium]